MVGAEEAGIAIVAVLVGMLVAVVFGVLLGALFLRWSVRILQGFSPSYGRALLTVFTTMIAGIALSFVLAFGLMAAGLLDVTAVGQTPTPEALTSLLVAQATLGVINFIAGLLLTALFVNLLIQQPDGSRIGFGRSVLVALLYMLMTMALLFVLALILAFVIGIGAGMAAAG